MFSFVALYRGTTTTDAKMVAVSSDARLAAQVATALLTSDFVPGPKGDPVFDTIARARRRALRIIQEEASDSEDSAS